MKNPFLSLRFVVMFLLVTLVMLALALFLREPQSNVQASTVVAPPTAKIPTSVSTSTPTASPTPTATYAVPTVTGLMFSPRCTGTVSLNAPRYFWIGSGQFMTAGTAQNPVAFVGGEKLSGNGVGDYCEVIVGVAHSFHKLVGTPTLTPTATSTPTRTATSTIAPTVVANTPAPKSVSGCAALVGKFVIPKGMPIWYVRNGQFSRSDPMYGGFKGGETLAVPVEERDGRCKTNARSDAVGDWWFSLADVQMPSAPPPSPAALSRAPAFGQAPSASVILPAQTNATGLTVVEESTEKSPKTAVDTTLVKTILEAKGWKGAPKVPATVKFIWLTEEEMSSLLQVRVGPVPDVGIKMGYSIPGTMQLILNSTPFTSKGVENDIALALCQLVIAQKGNNQVDPTAGGQDQACATAAVQKYKFVGQVSVAAKKWSGEINTTFGSSRPYTVDVGQISTFLADKELKKPSKLLISWETAAEMMAAANKAAQAAQAAGAPIVGAINIATFIAADLGPLDPLNIQGLSEPGVAKVYLLAGRADSGTIAHEIARLYACYIQGNCKNAGAGYEKFPLETELAGRALVVARGSGVGQTVSAAPAAVSPSTCGPFIIGVDGQAASPIAQELVNGYLSGDDSQCKIPRKVKFHWRSDEEILRLQSGQLTSDSFLVPDDIAGSSMDRFKLSEKGVVNIYLNRDRSVGVINSAIAHELCRIDFYYDKGDKTAGGDGYPGSPVATCENQVDAKYKFVK